MTEFEKDGITMIANNLQKAKKGQIIDGKTLRAACLLADACVGSGVKARRGDMRGLAALASASTPKKIRRVCPANLSATTDWWDVFGLGQKARFLGVEEAPQSPLSGSQKQCGICDEKCGDIRMR